MKLALLSDLHANQRALQACLAHARAAGATRFAVLGDLVGYGAEPAAVVDTVMELAAAGAIVLGGNHDDAALRPPGKETTWQDVSAAFTHAQLGAAHREFLAKLPLAAPFEGTLLVHASADDPGRWHYVDRPALVQRSLDAALRDWNVRRVFCGHVHEQQLYFQGVHGGPMPFAPVPGVAVPLAPHRSWLAVVGAVGQPRDGDPRAKYALFDVAQGRLAFHRIAYDHAAAAGAVRAAGLPDSFARRLELGR